MLPIYNKINSRVTTRLADIVGEKNIIIDDLVAFAKYAKDEMPNALESYLPEVVVKPSSEQEIKNIFELANQEMIPVTPRGGGTGLSGGAVPLHGGILLSLEKLNKIIEIDKDNMTITVQTGVITKQINQLLAEQGLFYPGYPMSQESCFIGGNIAENAGGSRAVKYGVTGKYLCGLTVVLPTGNIIKLGGKHLKDVTGLNLLQLMVGSEGTLGIFSEAILKIMPAMSHKCLIAGIFRNTELALTAAPKIISEGKIIPSALEFIDELSVQLAAEYSKSKLPFPVTGSILLIELEGRNEDELFTSIDIIENTLNQYEAIEVYAAMGISEMKKLWDYRTAVPESLYALSPKQDSIDISVSISNLYSVIDEISNIGKKHDLLVPCFGHAGDGNVHTHIINNREGTDSTWENDLPLVLKDIFSVVHKYGGAISGEHGIGIKRQDFVREFMNPAEISLIRNIKKVFDPNLILNPGKMVDWS